MAYLHELAVEVWEMLKTKIPAIETKVNEIDAEIGTDNSENIAAIKAKTDNLPVSPCATADVANALVDVKHKDINATFDPSTDSLEAIADMLLAKLGLTTQMASDKTMLGYENSFYQHIHNPSKCYPTLADGVIVTGGAGVWALGNFVEIIPANTITTAFDIHYIVFEGASATDIYEFVLYKGTVGNEVEIGRVRVDRENAQSGVSNVPIQIPPQLANQRISAKAASKTGGGDTVTVSVYYHEYN